MEATNNDSSESSSDDSSVQLPSDDEIRKIIKNLFETEDLKEKSLKQLVIMIADKTDCDPDHLYEFKKSFIKKRKAIESKLQELAICESIQQQAKAEEGTERDKDEGPPLPSDDKLTAAAKKLARSPEVDLSTISNAAFLTLLSKRMNMDLSPKKQVVFRALEACKYEYEFDLECAPASPKAVAIPSRAPTNTVSHAEVLEIVSPTNLVNHTEVLEIPSGDYVSKDIKKVSMSSQRKDGMHYSEDLEQGRKIPEAAGLSWEDPFFDGESEDLVAVFDLDYSAMFWYYMKVAILTRLLPRHITLFVFILIVVVSAKPEDELSGYRTTMAILFLVAIALPFINLYGNFRLIKSQVYCAHLAVARDGVQKVTDDHLSGNPLVAAFHCWDPCLLVTRKDQVLPFDQINLVTIKKAGEIDDFCCCCQLCCGICLRTTFAAVTVDGTYLEGIKDPQGCHKLIWAMKRDKGEQIHRDNLETNRASTALLHQLVMSQQNANMPQCAAYSEKVWQA